jgi:hypothetical protein
MIVNTLLINAMILFAPTARDRRIIFQSNILNEEDLAMKQIALLLLLFGIGSAALNFVGYEFRLLSWIDTWGETVGWAIRGALFVAGVILYVIDMRMNQGLEAAETPQETPMAAPQPEPMAPPPHQPMAGGQPQGQ